jgi:hypothetical protein
LKPPATQGEPRRGSASGFNLQDRGLNASLPPSRVGSASVHREATHNGEPLPLLTHPRPPLCQIQQGTGNAFPSPLTQIPAHRSTTPQRGTGNGERGTGNALHLSTPRAQWRTPPGFDPRSLDTGGSLVPRSRPGYSWRTPLGFGFPCSVAALTARIMTAHHSAIPQQGTGNGERPLHKSPPTASPNPTGNREQRTGNNSHRSTNHRPPLGQTQRVTGNREPGTTLTAPRRSERSARRKASGVRWQRRPGASSTPL